MSNMKNICFNCENGVSGDMIVGALLDVGANKQVLKHALKSLKLENYLIKIKKVNKNGISATDFDVKLKEKNFDHDLKFLYGNKKVDLEQKEKRNLEKIIQIISNSNFTDNAKQISIKIFKIIAESEAKAHGINVDEVIFHETGAMDSIIDIVSIAVCLDNLNIKKAYAFNLFEGKGFINTRVGKLPIPTPAVKNIAEKFNIEIKQKNLEFELITPTGLGALAAICEFSEPKRQSAKVGYGAGKRNYDLPGVLKVELF